MLTKKYLLYVLLFCSLFPVRQTSLLAQEQRGVLCGWEHLDMSHSFKDSNWFGTCRIEHNNIQYRELDKIIMGTTAGYRFTDWLKAGIGYDLLIEPGGIAHRPVAYITGTLKEGNLTVSLREKYQHIWTVYSSSHKNELKSKLTVQYAIPENRFSPYLAMEVYTWDKWMKTRHYAGTDFSLNKNIDFEAFYIYFTYATMPANHVIGLGMNITL